MDESLPFLTQALFRLICMVIGQFSRQDRPNLAGRLTGLARTQTGAPGRPKRDLVEPSSLVGRGATNVIGSAVVVNQGPSWHVMGVGDYNNDGRSDILWQNEMNGTNLLTDVIIGSPGPTWHA
jgi:hypothetical protein